MVVIGGMGTVNGEALDAPIYISTILDRKNYLISIFYQVTIHSYEMFFEPQSITRPVCLEGKPRRIKAELLTVAQCC